MICRESELRLSDYIDGYLSPAESLRVERHLMLCESCRNVHSDLTRLIGESKALPELDPPPGLWDRLAAEVAKAPASAKAPGMWRRLCDLDFHFRLTLPQLVGSAAALLVLFIGADLFVRNLTATSSALANKDGSVLVQVPSGQLDRLGYDVSALEPHQKKSIDTFQELVDRRKDQWDPRVRLLFERSMATINTSLDECWRATQEDPSDEVARDMLDVTYTKKLNLLRDFSGF